MYYHWVFFFIFYYILCFIRYMWEWGYGVYKKRPNINIIGSLGNSFEKSKLLIFLLFDVNAFSIFYFHSSI